MDTGKPITSIKGVGDKTAASFEKMNIYRVRDLLMRFPRSYVQYPKVETIDELESLTESHHAIAARVTTAPVTRTGRMQVTILTIGSVGHKMQLIWYRQPYVRSTLAKGGHFVFYGKVVVKEGKYVMEQPVIYTPEKYQEIEECFLPVYSLTEGVTNNLMIRTMRQALDTEELLADPLPQAVRHSQELCEYNYAMKQIHFPDTMEDLIVARRRLVFDEFFEFIMGMQYQKGRKEREKNLFVFTDRGYVDGLIAKLPYDLTGAQLRTIAEILDNMASEHVMQRLVQGDVGSGKTVVAFLAMAWAAHNGYQSAIMAPTEVLARQHFESFTQMCEDFGIDVPIILLTGSLTAAQKRKAYARMEKEPNAMIVGTHALIQEKAVYANLSLVITDEQHRFGVNQRDTLAEKGSGIIRKPHVLVMSATPIPRTLAIILYGDLDISVIDEVPARRLPIKNAVVTTAYRPKAYSFIADQVAQGHQAYVICPLVEESENMEGENVTDYARTLADELHGEIKVGILHGKMKNEKKNKVMEAFARNELQVLVSTTVVEVGVNVPNATVMMIENADRFGLAQLHQLRGRVGRGDAQSYCIMVNSSNSKTSQKRLGILNASNDGFYIANEDLKLRGPGDFFGIRQSGDLAFQLADIYQDAEVLKEASREVSQILAKDPQLMQPEHAQLNKRMQMFMEDQMEKLTL